MIINKILEKHPPPLKITLKKLFTRKKDTRQNDDMEKWFHIEIKYK